MSLNFNSFLEVRHREYNKRIQTAGCRYTILFHLQTISILTARLGTMNLHLYSWLLAICAFIVYLNVCLARISFIHIHIYREYEWFSFEFRIPDCVCSRFFLTLSQCGQNSTIYRYATVQVANTLYLQLYSRSATVATTHRFNKILAANACNMRHRRSFGAYKIIAIANCNLHNCHNSLNTRVSAKCIL